MTTQYVADEDRILISASTAKGGTVRLWLTHRIVGRLVPALAKLVQPRHQDPVYCKVMDEIAQQNAEQRQEPQEPVIAASPGHEWLVRKINIQKGERGVALVFVGPDGERARISFSGELLRQWLGIVRRVCRTADWTDADRSDRMPETPAAGKHPTVLH